MRKVTRTIAEAFFSGVAKASGNTCTDGDNVWLHGNKIAEKDEFGNLYISNAGWKSNTTKERLNGLLELGNFQQFPVPHIFQKNFKWFLSISKTVVPFPSNEFVSVESEINKIAKWEGEIA
ncbi:uncharacterized protein METZ01_LOCUS359299 [marine metagenome]|uniref:Uncharacterized protein n=1 Tax=marine metagenome TaxID=408172 RepID=A0A382SAJ1_9ZZZZ